MAEVETLEGAFLDSLKRNNKQIRDDRAESIGEEAQITYKREVEDIALRIRGLRREQENMLDMSAKTSYDLKIAEDFNPRTYVDQDIAIGIKIRNEEIKLEIAKKRYEYLFGGTL